MLNEIFWLVNNQGRVFGKAQICNRVWTGHSYGEYEMALSRINNM